VQIELINIGTELLLGRVLNTHQQWICAQLANLGFVVDRQVAIPDQAGVIQSSVREALSRADLVIATGGLGPTSDDITRDLIADLLGKKLNLDVEVLNRIENFFAQRKRRIPESTKVQAMVPEGAQVLHNANGTAPGLAMKLETNPFSSRNKSALLVMLPGPPRELRPMFSGQVVPLLKEFFPQQTNFICRTFRTTGIGESFVEEKISAKLRPLAAEKIELGYCARVGEVDVRIVARGAEAENSVAEAEKIIRENLGPYIFGTDEDLLESTVVRLLAEQKKKLALAESCTGGFIANRVTNVPGASGIFVNGFVTYSNESKQRLLGVRAETLAQHGAVSEPTAREMADGARTRSQVDFAIAVTGIAGPGGGTEEKPVGTVFVALSTPRETVVQHHVFRYDRETFKFVVSQEALEMLRRRLTAQT
jgi:nicotinamide-nucleotide amidase